MRKIEFEVYEVRELTGEARQVALEELAEGYQDIITWHIEELLQSIRSAGRHYNHNVVDWSAGLYSHNYLKVDSNDWKDQTNGYKNMKVEEIRDSIEEGKRGSCPFTGVYYDCLFFDYFAQFDREDINFNNISDHLKRALKFMLDVGIDLLEDEAEDTETLLEFAEANEYEFTKDGHLFTL